MIELTLAELQQTLQRGARVALLVRHAERPKIDPDDPTFGDAVALTYEGCRTARKLGEAFFDVRGEASFASSPLMRTRMTASLIAEGMGCEGADILVDGRLGNESFYYADTNAVLEVFKPENFFGACVEYFKTGAQRGFHPLDAASDAFENWIDAHWKTRFFVVATHDLYVAAFLTSRKVGSFTRENWVRFLDAAAIIEERDGTRHYALVRTGLSTGIVGVRKRKVSGIVFDFGGVMTTQTMPERVRGCVDACGLSWAGVKAGFAKYRHLLDGGFLSMEEMYDLIFADEDVSPSEAARERILEEDVSSFCEGFVNLETLAWMREIKEAGYKIGILTNMPHSFVPHFKESYGDFIDLADALVISGDERMFKPQQRIYRLLQERIGLPPEELCFVDDVEENCEAARAAGWQAVQFLDNAQAARDVKSLL